MGVSVRALRDRKMVEISCTTTSGMLLTLVGETLPAVVNQKTEFTYFAAVCRSIPSALAMAYGVSPFFARCTIFWRISIPSFGRPIFMPLAFARAIPALVRSLTFCASNFAIDESNARSMFRTSSLSVARCGSV